MYPSRSELAHLHKSVQFTVLSGPHHIPSSPSCQHPDACDCSLDFTCPLCPFEADHLELVENHYENLHWKARQDVGRFTVIPCGTVHVTARQSLAPSHRSLNTNHLHCPLCVLVFINGIDLVNHFRSSHPTASHTEDSHSANCFSRNVKKISDADNGVTGKKFKIKFRSEVPVLEFPLALSIAEQSGGRSETRKAPRCFEHFSYLHDTMDVAIYDIEYSGCNREPLKLFRNCCFVICGIDIPQSMISAIFSLGGVVTGASYNESDEWRRITHVLLGNRIGQKAVRALMKTLNVKFSEAPGFENSVDWVSSEWVRERVEKGSLLGRQRIFSATLLDRYFQAKETAARMEKRRLLRCKPEIPCIPFQINASSFSETSSRRPSPVLETSANESLQFKATPEASPIIMASSFPSLCVNKENSVSLMSSPALSPVIQTTSPIPTPIVMLGRPKPVLETQSIEPLHLRRSRRLSALGSLSNPQHTIKKD